MATSTAYGFKNVAATVDGQPIIGVWDGDDAIVIAPGTDRGTGLVGADGSGIFSITSNRSATITLRLQPTSPTHRLLMQKLKRQEALASTRAAFPVVVMDNGNGEGGSADRCFIQTAPSDQKGVNAVVREWVLWTADWNPEIPNAA